MLLLSAFIFLITVTPSLYSHFLSYRTVNVISFVVERSLYFAFVVACFHAMTSQFVSY